MEYVLMGRCRIIKNGNIVGTGNRVSPSSPGDNLIIYNNTSNSISYVGIEIFKNEKGQKALNGLKVVKMTEECKVVAKSVDGYRGRLTVYNRSSEKNTWTIVKANEEAAKVVNFKGEVKVISLENVLRLYECGKITNLWVKCDNSIDINKYMEINEPYQIVEIDTSRYKKDIQIELENSLDTVINIEEEVEEVVEKKEAVIETNTKNIVSGDEINKLYVDIIRRMEVGDILTIPDHAFKTLNIEVKKIMESSFDSSGNYNKFKWVSEVKIDTKDTESLLAVVSFDGKIRIQVFSSLSESHDITYGDIESDYIKHKLDRKYL